MKQRDFNAFRSPEAERFSGSQFHDAVQTLDNARRNGAYGPEPVENQVPMTPQALSHLLPRADLACQVLVQQQLLTTVLDLLRAPSRP